MDYVEQVKKINALAKELMKHGMAKSTDEAIVQAQKMLEKGTDVSDFFDKARAKTEEGVAMQNPEDMEKLIGMAVDKKMKPLQERVANELETIKGKMNEIISEINKIEDQIIKLKVQNRQEPQQMQQKPAGQESKPQQNHPRTGTYSGEQVAIDKVFYFGHK